MSLRDNFVTSFIISIIRYVHESTGNILTRLLYWSKGYTPKGKYCQWIMVAKERHLYRYKTECGDTVVSDLSIYATDKICPRCFRKVI